MKNPELEMMKTIVSSENENYCVFVMREGKRILRFFLGERKGDIYYPDYELQAFKFPNQDSALEFAENVTEMSALDLMVFMQPKPA